MVQVWLSDDPLPTAECPAIRPSATAPLHCAEIGPRPLAVDFLGDRLTNDGGLAWLSATDVALGLATTLAAVIPDWHW